MQFFARSVLSSVLLATAAIGQYTYDSGPKGPENWGNLNYTDNVCFGDSNSPIALQTKSCSQFANYTFQPGTCTTEQVKFVLLNNVVEVAYPNSTVCDSGTVTVPNNQGTYSIFQFHIHLSSEHTLDNQFFGAELHIVHTNADGSRFAVVGIFIEPNSPDDNSLFGTLLEGWQEEYAVMLANCNVTVSTARSNDGGRRGLLRDDTTSSSSNTKKNHRRLEAFNIYDLIPSGSTFYNYDGGLTTPPCLEKVEWNVADTPLAISVRQFAELTSLVFNFRNSTCQIASIASESGSTSRPVQELNGRDVQRICPEGYVEEPAPSPPTSPTAPTAAVTTGTSAAPAASSVTSARILAATGLIASMLAMVC